MSPSMKNSIAADRGMSDLSTTKFYDKCHLAIYGQTAYDNAADANLENYQIVTTLPNTDPRINTVAEPPKRPAKTIRIAPPVRPVSPSPSCISPCSLLTTGDPADSDFDVTINSRSDRGRVDSAHIAICLAPPVMSVSPSPSRSSQCSLPTAEDPTDNDFGMTLYSRSDEGRVDSAHIAIRREILEVRRTMSGRVFFQCALCKHLPRGERAKMSTFAPRGVGGLYRAMARFATIHVKGCDHVPQKFKDMTNRKSSRTVNARGSKEYWAKSALNMGLRNGDDGRSIVYCGIIKS